MRRLMLLAVAGFVAAVLAGPAAAAPGQSFSVTSQAQSSTMVDANHNGDLDGGDYQLISGELVSAGRTAGAFQARVAFDGSAVSVMGGFTVAGGIAIVTGTFAPEAGPSAGLRIDRAFGPLRQYRGGTVFISDTGSDSTVFTFVAGFSG